MRVRRSRLIIAFFLVLLVVIGIIFYFNWTKFNGPREISENIQVSDYDIIYGQEDAPLTVFLYANYGCSFCQQFYNEVLPTIKERYIDTGKVKLVVKLVVLTNDPNSYYAHQTAACVNKFGSLEKFQKLLLYDYQVIYTTDFRQLVDEFIAVNPYVAECILYNSDYKYLNENRISFIKYKLSGTPTFIINKRIYSGYSDLKTFERILIKELY